MRSTRRRMGAPAWLGLTLVVALPALAEAQLFPNRNITRQKESCAAEPPFYSTVRRNYFGYYPTCWSKFPDGWGCPCPNPELPNRVAAFNEQPRDKFKPIVPDSELDGGLAPDEMAPGADPRPTDDSAMPPVPNPTGRSPFGAELNPPEVNPKPVTPDSGGAPRTSRSPAPAARPGAPTTSALAAPSATVGLLEMPRMAPPTAPSANASDFNPGTLALVPEATLTSNDASARTNLGPLHANPMPNGSIPVASELSADPTVLAGPLPTASPAQAPQRRGILGGLFNSSKRRR